MIIEFYKDETLCPHQEKFVVDYLGLVWEWTINGIKSRHNISARLKEGTDEMPNADTKQ